MSARPGHACGLADCTIDWLWHPTGPSDPDWRARVRAEIDAAPRLVGLKPTQRGAWSSHYPCCRICGTTESRNCGAGRCSRCDSYWRKHGTERPAYLWSRAS